MKGMRKHIHGLYFFYRVGLFHQGNVARLCGAVAAYVHNSFRGNFQYLLHYFRVHAVAGRIGDEYVRVTVVF